ncbi:hypothetical protein Tco_0690505 [Tanacetum coccineum]
MFHSKTKHIEIRHHFIRDSYEKKLIQVIKIHTDHNVADLLTKAFDVNEYALTVNPTVYESCIQQFWATAKAKTLNGERHIQALVDKNKVISTEKSVRSDLILEDVDGTECLPNDVIFEQLTLMGYENLTQKLTFYKAYFSSQWKFLIHTILQCLSAKTTAWNEFSSTMASAIICLATNQKFNFSKYIFDHMMKNLEGEVKFLMYTRFVQVFLDKQVERMSKHKGIYVTPSHTKKIFANMKREGKGFSRRITPLFQTMMVQAPEDMGEDSAAPTDSHSTPIITQPSSSKPQKKKSKRKQRKDSGPQDPIHDEATNEEPISTLSCDLPQSGLKRLRKVGSASRVESSNDVSLGAQEDASKQVRKIANLDVDAEVTLIDETQERYDEEIIVEKEVSLLNPITTAGEVVTTASATTTICCHNTLLVSVTSTRPKAKGIVFHDQEEQASAFTPIVSSSQLPQAKDKGKLHAQEQAELERMQKERVAQEEASRAAIIEELDRIQAMIEADEQLAARL